MTTIQLYTNPGCIHDPGCADFSGPLLTQLGSGPYNWPVSILDLHDYGAYLAEHRTARKRANRARRLGYECGQFERADFQDDIHCINTSMPERQGRPMAPSYREFQAFEPLPDYPCPRHRIEAWGVFRKDELVAYLMLYVSGDLAMVSQILGHGDHLENDVMYLLVLEALRHQPLPLTVFYNRHDSGTDGLRFFKERLGFQPDRVEWAA